MNKKEAVEELKRFLLNLEKGRSVGFRIQGKGNIIVGNYAEGFATGFEISGDENTAIFNEAKGSNYDKIKELIHYLMAEIDRPNTSRSRLQRLKAELKDWTPTIAGVVLKILTKYGVL